MLPDDPGIIPGLSERDYMSLNQLNLLEFALVLALEAEGLTYDHASILVSASYW